MWNAATTLNTSELDISNVESIAAEGDVSGIDDIDKKKDAKEEWVRNTYPVKYWEFADGTVVYDNPMGVPVSYFERIHGHVKRTGSADFPCWDIECPPCTGEKCKPRHCWTPGV